jgi:hypothetical protein
MYSTPGSGSSSVRRTRHWTVSVSAVAGSGQAVATTMRYGSAGSPLASEKTDAEGSCSSSLSRRLCEARRLVLKVKMVSSTRSPVKGGCSVTVTENSAKSETGCEVVRYSPQAHHVISFKLPSETDTKYSPFHDIQTMNGLY